MKVTDYFIKKKIDALAKVSTQRNRDFHTLKEAHNILIFYDLKDQDKIEPCLETLRMMHKKVLVCIYTSQTKDSFPELYLPVNAKSDVSALGIPKEDVCNKVCNIKADLLIDLSGRNNHVMKYLMLLHPCPFKVGLKRNGQEIYDFSIVVTDRDDIMYLFGQILFYLKTIRAK